MDNDVATLQCLVLAQIFCLLKADYSRLLKYKGLAIGLSQRLGLHQSQKRFALDALTSETRKKLFWSLYTVDWYASYYRTSLIAMLTAIASLLPTLACPSSSGKKMCTASTPSMPTMSTSLRRAFCRPYRASLPSYQAL